MTKQTYFKIIEFDDYQVLVEKFYDEEEETEAIRIVFYIDSFNIVNKLTYKTEKLQQRAFELIDSEMVKDIINASLKALNYDTTI